MRSRRTLAAIVLTAALSSCGLGTDATSGNDLSADAPPSVASSTDLGAPDRSQPSPARSSTAATSASEAPPADTPTSTTSTSAALQAPTAIATTNTSAPPATAPSATTDTSAPVGAGRTTTTIEATVGVPEGGLGLNEGGVSITLDETATLACALTEFARDALAAGNADGALTHLAGAGDRASSSAVPEVAGLAGRLHASTSADAEQNVEDMLSTCISHGHQI